MPAFFLLILIIAITWPCPAQAYIDPGTTSAIFGGLAYILTFIGAGLAILFKPLIKLYKKIFKRDGSLTSEQTED